MDHQQKTEDHPAQQPFTNPDDYLNLDNNPQPELHPQPLLQAQPQPPQVLTNPHNKPSPELEATLTAGENATQKILPSTEKKVPKQSKKIKKKQQSSEESFTDLKEGTKGGPEIKSKGRKPKNTSEGARNRVKPHKKQKIDQDEQIRRQVKELTNTKELSPQEKVIERQKAICKRATPVIGQGRCDQPRLALPWQHGKQKQQDLNSVEAELSQESIIRRNQSYTYRRLVQLIAQQGENLLQQISQLPPLLY